MQKLAPTLDKAKFALKPIRNDVKRHLLDLLDAAGPGKKALVLEPYFVQPLGLIVDALILKEHGVEMFVVLENQPSIVSVLVERGVRHLIYLLHSRIEAMQAAVSHISMCRDLKALFDFSVLIIPRKLQTCQILLDYAGLLGDITLKGCPMPWVPLEEDILSLELPFAFKDLSVAKDTGSLWDIAHSLVALQISRGAIPHIKGIGPWASAVQKIMSKIQKEMGSSAPTRGNGGIETLILIDRRVDMITPMCTQLTYEGLLDEILGLSYGQIRPALTRTENQQSRKVSGLNSTDPVFAETRDLFYLGARKWLNESLRSIQQFRDAGMAGADITQLKGFVAELRDKFSRIPLHTSLIEQIGSIIRDDSFAFRQKIEAELLDEGDVLGSIEDLMAQGEGVLPVLRLLCLYCAVHGGIPKRHWDNLRRDIVNTYGHQHLITLEALSKAGLLQRKESNPGAGSSAMKGPWFRTAKQAFKLLVQEGEAMDEENPRDIHFAYAGYAPLSVRLVESALSDSNGWSTKEPALSALLNPFFELVQTVDEKGMPIERIDRSKPLSDKRNRTVMVAFIGGVTHAEISALRFLSRKGIVDCDFVVATTQIVNGASLLKPLLPGVSPSVS